MKRLKKILALALAMAMVLSMTALSAFAAYSYDPVATDAAFDESASYFTDAEGTNAYTGGAEGFDAAKEAGLFVRTGEPDEPTPEDPTPDDPTPPDYTKGSIQLTDEPAKFKDSHTYQVYQIFTGDYDGTQLSNVKYGANYGSTGSSVPKSELDAISDARAFAEGLMANEHEKLNGNPVATLTKDNFKAENLAPGYYLIVDTVSGDLANGDAYSQYIVQVLGAVTLETKKDVTEGDKKIKSDDHPATEDAGQNPGVSEDGKTDNVSIGDKVNFEITAKVPSHATDYDYYYFIINDTLTSGLTLDVSTIAVTSDGTPATLAAGTDYELYVADTIDTADQYKTPSGTHTFEVALLDAKSFAGKTITVNYTATLNENAVVAGTGNLNTQNVTYSNNPNEDYDGSQDNNNPGKPKSDSEVPTGTTPDSTTKTFTSGIKLQKLDQDNNPLNGAEFTIEGDSINKVVRNTETFVEATTGAYWKLDTGAYTTDAPITADRMDLLEGAKAGDDGYVRAEAGYTGDVISVGGENYRVVNENEVPTHILIKKNDMLYASTTIKYNKTTTTTVLDTTAEHKSQSLKVNDDGTLNFKGLGAGTYTITESKVPDGYTAAEPATVVISFDNETQEFTCTVNGKEVEADGTTNLFPMDVINRAGHTLPSTGGIGTTIFYVVGAILVIGAGVVMITRRRMDA